MRQAPGTAGGALTGPATAAGPAGPLSTAVRPGALLFGDVAAVDAGEGPHQLAVGLAGLLDPGGLVPGPVRRLGAMRIQGGRRADGPTGQVSSRAQLGLSETEVVMAGLSGRRT